ncbi:hypothetical protein G7Y89_g11888 [Cudoniella acicularis]|uniref:J domain-containing protein n=1 Tax=Cudoniella acicularis TaxID=354080 RepID=A0A8H4RDQ2_9HELO|nr:hypothetical protein G7Y89_g11888 [Cudoniella acicularis]
MSGSNLLSMAGWTFLPNMATGWIQSIYYGITIRAGNPRPQPGSPKYITHRRRIHIGVVSLYLLYTIYEADWDIRRASDFYQDLRVSPDASERDIKSRFRRLAATYHPDKLTSSSPSSEGYFVHLKLAQDTLLNPAKRFAYERFGPSMLEWQRCFSTRDYIIQGLQSVLPYYGIAAIAMYVLGFLGYLEWGKYWRWLTLIILCVFELHTISRPYFPHVATKLINPLLTTFTNHPPILPFQLIQLARKASVTMYIAFSQIGPLISPPTVAPGPDGTEAQLARLEASVRAADVQAAGLINIDMSPFSGDQAALKDVQGKVKEWLVQNTIRNDPEVRDALGNLLKKRRVDAPAGARGNR